MGKIRDTIRTLKNALIVVVLVSIVYLLSIDIALFFLNTNLGKLTKQIEKIQTSITDLNKK